MSDQLSAAAAAMGLPEALVERSAEARAAETGASVEDILASWAGGEAASVPTPSQPPTDTAETAEEATVAEPEAPAVPEVVVEIPEESSAPTRPPALTGPFEPPVLVGATDNPMAVLAGVVALFVVVVLVGLVGPSIPTDTPGARTSEIPYTEGALNGQDIYLDVGCAACHTQMVRPVVADVGLGPVTLNDTDQVLGTRRFGPDLSDVGSRVTSAQIEAIINGLGDHPAQSLDTDDMSDLVAYLSESAAASLPEGEVSES